MVEPKRELAVQFEITDIMTGCRHCLVDGVVLRVLTWNGVQGWLACVQGAIPSRLLRFIVGCRRGSALRQTPRLTV